MLCRVASPCVWSACPFLIPAPVQSLQTSLLERPLPTTPSHQSHAGSSAAVSSPHGEGRHHWCRPILETTPCICASANDAHRPAAQSSAPPANSCFRFNDGTHVVLEAHSRDSAARHHLRTVRRLLQANRNQELRAAGPLAAAPLRPDRPPSGSFPAPDAVCPCAPLRSHHRCCPRLESCTAQQSAIPFARK